MQVWVYLAHCICSFSWRKVLKVRTQKNAVSGFLMHKTVNMSFSCARSKEFNFNVTRLWNNPDWSTSSSQFGMLCWRWLDGAHHTELMIDLPDKTKMRRHEIWKQIIYNYFIQLIIYKSARKKWLVGDPWGKLRKTWLSHQRCAAIITKTQVAFKRNWWHVAMAFWAKSE